jgi:hypothetical protein
MSCLNYAGLETIHPTVEDRAEATRLKPVAVPGRKDLGDRVMRAVTEAVDAALANGSMPA